MRSSPLGAADGGTVLGRAVVGVGLSRHFRTPTSSSGQTSSGKIVFIKNLFKVDYLLTKTYIRWTPR